LEFIQSDADYSVFTKRIGRWLIIIMVYIDDFLLFLSNLENIRLVKHELESYFKMKDLKEAKWILQMLIEKNVLNSGE